MVLDYSYSCVKLKTEVMKCPNFDRVLIDLAYRKDIILQHNLPNVIMMMGLVQFMSFTVGLYLFTCVRADEINPGLPITNYVCM